MVSRIREPSASQTTTPASTAATTATAGKRKRRTLDDIAAERRAQSAGGKITATAQTAGAGATVRAQGKAIAAIDSFKEQLRSGVVDGQSLAAYRESRQADFDKRKEDVKKSFETMQTAIADGDAVRQTIADNLQEIVDLMPADMVKAANIHKTNKDDEVKDGLLTRFKNWVTRKPAPAKLDELELDKLLLRQIDLSEASINTLEDRVKGFQGVADNLAASRIEFAQQLEESVVRFNGAVDVLAEVDGEIKAIEAEQATLDPMSKEFALNEKSLFELRNQSLEITRYAAFLNDWITNLRDFEVTGEQLATMLGNAEANANRVLATGFKLLELQSVTTGVVAQVASVINAADWTMLVLDTTTQNLTRAIEYTAGRVSAFQGNMEEWMQRTHDASMQMAGAMLESNIKSEEGLRAYASQLLADHAAGKRAVAIPTSAKLEGPRTSNPMRARTSELSQFLKGVQAKQASRAGLRN